MNLVDEMTQVKDQMAESKSIVNLIVKKSPPLIIPK